MEIERGSWGEVPFAAVGSGQPLVVLPGLLPIAGEIPDRMVRMSVAPFVRLPRRVVVLNRWAGLPDGLTMTDLAAGHAAAIRIGVDGPTDVVGVSTGGSIAQQLAAQHPDVVRRLALVCTACRLADLGKDSQVEMAAALRRGRTPEAVGLLARDVVPGPLGSVAAVIGRAISRHVIPDATAAADLAATLEAEDAFDLAALPAITAPTLVLAGDRDRFYRRELFEETAALIPGSHLRIIERRGHVTLLSDRRAVATLGGFLGL